MDTNLPMTPLRKLRLERKVTLDDIARATGLNNGTVSRIETMKANASPEVAEKIVGYFGQGITELEILYPERFIAGDAQPPQGQAAA